MTEPLNLKAILEGQNPRDAYAEARTDGKIGKAEQAMLAAVEKQGFYTTYHQGEVQTLNKLKDKYPDHTFDMQFTPPDSNRKGGQDARKGSYGLSVRGPNYGKKN